MTFSLFQTVYPALQHEAAHQDPQAGPRGDEGRSLQHQHRPDPQGGEPHHGPTQAPAPELS